MSLTEEVDSKDATKTSVAEPLGASLDGAESAAEEAASEPEYVPQYVTGFKLVIIVASLALGCFLMLVDTNGY